MSAPLVINTADGTCWTRRAVTRGGLALYAPEGVCSCPEFVMATQAELAEHGIAGVADVLPVPVGSGPWARVAELEESLRTAQSEVRRARAERDRMRERVSEPFGCAHCGVEKRSHGRRYLSGVGMHVWAQPSDEQVKARMLTRRVARMPLGFEGLWARVAELESGLPLMQEALFRALDRVSELERERHSTNAALADVTVAQRAAEGYGPIAAEAARWRAFLGGVQLPHAAPCQVPSSADCTCHLVDPSACAVCGLREREHAQRWTAPVGWHRWTAPSQRQIKARMRARRRARAGGAW